MLVSVLMPIHGKARFLQDAVQSVIDQDYNSWKLLMVLDRPSSELSDEAKRLTLKDARIESLVSPGSGIVDALNFGLEIADTNLIARLDSDDVMESSRLKKQVAYLNDFSDVVCVGSQLTLIDVDSNPISATNYPLSFKAIKRTLKYQNCIGHPSVMFRREAIILLGGYRKLLTGVEDYDLWLRLCKTTKIVNLKETLTKYRVYPDQYSKSFGDSYTDLEEVARLDSIFQVLQGKFKDESDKTSFREFVHSIRRENFKQHPLKVFSSYQGLFVSKIIRVRGSKTSKTVKLIRCAPLIFGITLVAPRTAFDILNRTLKAWLKKNK